jgi:O-antigen/teichoic acid export membrane protein
LVGELLSKSIPFLLLPYLTRVLGTAGYGDLSLYQVIAALLFISIGINQDGAIARYFYFYGKRAVGLINFTGTVYSTIVFLFLCIISYASDSELLFICSTLAFTQSIVANQLIIRQMQKNVKGYLLIQLFNSILSGLLTVLLFEVFTPSAMGRIYIVVTSNMATIIFSIFVVSGGVSESYRKVKINMRNFRSSILFIFSFGIPLLIHNISLFSKGQLDRIFVYNAYSDEQLGIYSAGFQLASILSIFLMAANKSVIPYYYEALKTKSISFLDISRWALFSLFLVPLPALIAFFLPDSLYALILGEGFIESKRYAYIFLLGIAMTIPYFISVNYLFYHGKTLAISVSTFLCSCFHVFLIATLGREDLSYMAFCLFITNFITFLSVYFFCWKTASIFDEKQQKES